MSAIEPDLPRDLVDALRAAPDDPDVWSVLGDWLQQSGHVRGELCAIDRARQDAPWGAQGRRLRERRSALLDAHRDVLVGPVDTPGLATTLRWDRGYPSALELDWTGPSSHAAAAFSAVLHHPAMRFLRTLTLTGTPLLLTSLVDQLAARDWPLLERLALGPGTQGILPVFAPLEPALARMPSLRELTLTAEYVDSFLDDLDPAPVQTLTLRGDVGLHGLRALRGRGLRSLTLDLFRDPPTGRNASDALHGMPPLDHLGLRGLVDVATFAPAPLDVRVLDLSMGDLDDTGARALAARADRFPRLERLVVHESRLTAAGIDALREAFPAVDAEGQDPELRGSVHTRVAETTRARRDQARTAFVEGRYDDSGAVYRSLERIAVALGHRSLEEQAWLGLATVASALGRPDRAAALQERLLERPPETPDKLSALAQTRRSQGHTHHAEELLERAIALGGPNGSSAIRVELATVQLTRGDLAAALATVQAAADLEREASTETSRTASVLGMVQQARGRFAEAEQAYVRALELEDWAPARLPIRLNLGQARWLLGRAAEAREAYEAVAAEAREHGIVRFEASAWADLGHLHLNGGHPAEAVRALETAVPLVQSAGALPKLGEVYVNLGTAKLALGDVDGAEQALRDGLVTMQQVGSRQWVALAWSGLADVHLQRDDRAAGRSACEEALAVQDALGDRWCSCRTRTQLADLSLAGGDLDAASAHLERAHADAVSAGNRRYAAWITFEQARVAHARGEDPVPAYRAALDALEPIGDPLMQGRALACLGIVEPHRLDEARALLGAAGDREGLDQIEQIAHARVGRPIGPGLFADWLRAVT
ncbi:MAG: tetratricopeptide repeat protein [Myxococcota bacterium]